MASSSGEPVKELYMAKSMEELNKKTSAKNMDYSTPKLYVVMDVNPFSPLK